MTEHPAWLELRRGAAPLVLSIPHTGLDLAGLEPRLVSPWLARKDADCQSGAHNVGWLLMHPAPAGPVGKTRQHTAAERFRRAAA